ncbi:MAG: T9SS type A sorting domain-containing protein [Chitinophagaceae bacterium]|nr:T9SS type A sorting domain-containing protein [Chitinophagaceae bacterium]
MDGINWVTIGFVAGKGNSNSQTDYKYTDAGLSLKRYYYRLKQYDLDDRFTFSNIVKVELNHNHGNYVLGQNYPNPFDEATNISYYIPKTCNVRISLIDVNGRVIKVLQDRKNQTAGGYTLSFNRSSIAKGIYYYKMEAGEYIETKKMIIQ